MADPPLGTPHLAVAVARTVFVPGRPSTGAKKSCCVVSYVTVTVCSAQFGWNVMSVVPATFFTAYSFAFVCA